MFYQVFQKRAETRSSSRISRSSSWISSILRIFKYWLLYITIFNFKIVRNSGKSAEILQKISWNVLEICILKNRQFHIISLFHLVIPIRPDGSGGTTWPIRGSHGIPTTPPLHTRRSPAIGFAWGELELAFFHARNRQNLKMCRKGFPKLVADRKVQMIKTRTTQFAKVGKNLQKKGSFEILPIRLSQSSQH